MILKIFKIRSTVKELKEDPGKFAGEEAGGLVLGMFIIPFISGILFLGLLFILGFTEILWGPFGFFKFLFFLFLFPSILVFFILLRSYKLIRQSTKKVVDSTLKVESKVVE
jgi:hypothetical protein